MDISVIICTFNRAESLRLTLESLTAAELPPGISWEVLVVDNNSSDHTSPVCTEYVQKLPLHYHFEERQGKSNALNVGLEHARGKLLLFTDDDVSVAPGWLRAFWDAALRHGGVAFFGGRVQPRFDAPPRAWVLENCETLLANMFLHVNPSSSEIPIRTAVGANVAMRAEVLDGLRFRPDLGPDGTDTVRSEEIELLQSLVKRGLAGLHVPEAVAFHRIPPSRMTERYVRRWSFGEGMSRVRRGQIDPASTLFGAPRYLWRVFLANAANYLLTRPFSRSKVWLSAEIDAAAAFGSIHECRRGRARR